MASGIKRTTIHVYLDQEDVLRDGETNHYRQSFDTIYSLFEEGSCLSYLPSEIEVMSLRLSLLV